MVKTNPSPTHDSEDWLLDQLRIVQNAENKAAQEIAMGNESWMKNRREYANTITNNVKKRIEERYLKLEEVEAKIREAILEGELHGLTGIVQGYTPDIQGRIGIIKRDLRLSKLKRDERG